MAFGIGFAIGAEVDLIGYLVARYFGMAAYGKIYGMLYAAFVIGVGSSPILIAKLHNISGGYTDAVFTSAIFVAVSAVLFLLLPRFEDKAGSRFQPKFIS